MGEDGLSLNADLDIEGASKLVKGKVEAQAKLAGRVCKQAKYWIAPAE